MIEALVSAIVEGFFAGTGRRLFGLFGKQPHYIVMVFTGMASFQAYFCIGRSPSVPQLLHLLQNAKALHGERTAEIETRIQPNTARSGRERRR